MGDRGEDMQQRTTGRIQIRVAAIRTEPIWYAVPGDPPGRPTVWNSAQHRCPSR